ncbi:MAG: NAD(P)H-dependent oxidoreductase subunit E [Candidatus Omnitrophica bacterium]|nr:NAD(P)H-dependent oxidoreductase subunit E [Candidatus Omnitrophota bacterium]
MDKIAGQYEVKRAALLPLLRFVQQKHGWITPEIEQNMAEYLEMPLVQVHEVVCFYHLLNQHKKGHCHLSVCQTTACSLRGADEMIQYISDKLKIRPGETTADGRFSLSVVECLGACDQAPVMQCNEEYVGLLDKKKIDKIVDR